MHRRTVAPKHRARRATRLRRAVAHHTTLAGVAVAAAGSAVAGLGEAESAVFVLVAAVLLYAGVVAASGARVAIPSLLPARDLTPRPDPET